MRNGVVNPVLLFVGLLSLILGGCEGPLSSDLATPMVGRGDYGEQT